MASLEPQISLNSHRASSRPRPTLASRSLSQLPRFHEYHHKPTISQGTTKEEMMALLRSTSPCAPSAESSTSSCHSARGPVLIATPSTSMPSISPQVIAEARSMDASFSSTGSLSPHARKQLLRSARKVGYILGETPVLCTGTGASDKARTIVETSELGVLSSSPAMAGAATIGSMNERKRLRPTADLDSNMYDGLATAFAGPRQYTNLPAEPPTPFVPTLSRVPPVLKVDCSYITGTSKRSRREPSDEIASDAQSFISTTTTATIANDLFSPSTSYQSNVSPVETRFALHEQGRELPREARRSRIAKLSRHLGEAVPTDLVFPPDLEAKVEPIESYVLVTFEDASPVSPLADKASTPKRKVIEPPVRSSSLRRRKRRSFQLDSAESTGSSNSTPSPSTSTSCSTEKDPVGSIGSKCRPACTLSRSQSVRSRSRKHENSSPAVDLFRNGPSFENAQVHPTSAPAVQTAYSTREDSEPSAKEVTQEEELGGRTPLSDAHKALNVRRAQKMLSMFGEAPPQSLLSTRSKCDSPVALSRSAMGGARFKRHSISSILTQGSSFMDPPEPATFDSPISPITPRPRILDGETVATPTSNTASRNGSKPSPLTPRRRASLSVLPDTPPPFSQYFDPPISHALSAHDGQGTKSARSSQFPSDAMATHSPPSSSESSGPPPTPRSSTGAKQSQGGQEQDPGAIFRERRVRAAKLARFFGVGYGDLYPALVGVDDDPRMSTSSFDSIRSARLESFDKEKEKVKEKEKKLAAKRSALTRVSVMVQREVVDPGRPAPSLSSSESSLSLSSSSSNSASESTETKPEVLRSKTTTAVAPEPSSSESSTTDHDGTTTGCYAGLGFGASLTPSRGSSMRRRQQTGAGASSNRTSRFGGSGAMSGLGFGFGLGACTFSLGRQSRRTGPPSGETGTNSSPAPGSATLGRKCSMRTMGGRALTLGQRRSIFARASCGEFGIGSSKSNGTVVSSTDAMRLQKEKDKEREREMMCPRVRVGEKVADVNEVMARLRELR